MNLAGLAEWLRRRCCCRSGLRRYVLWGLIAVGALLVILCVPLRFWAAALGVVCILIGVLLILDGR